MNKIRAIYKHTRGYSNVYPLEYYFYISSTDEYDNEVEEIDDEHGR